MRNGLIKNGLVFSTIFLFIGVSILPIVSSSELYNEPIKSKIKIIEECDWIVDDEGDGDFINIQDAIDNANDNDIICIYSGEYEGNVTIDKEVEIIGYDIEYLSGNVIG